MTKQLILGSPGCGKTTKLIDITLDYMLDGEVLYLTFSKGAIKEVRQRMKKINKDLFACTEDMFRTSHSFCFGLMRLKNTAIMQLNDYRNVCREADLPIPHSFGSSDPGYIGNTTDKMLEYLNRKRMSKNNYVEVGCPFKVAELKKLWTALVDYKIRKGKYDYTDLIVEGIKILKDAQLNYKAVIVDEAQDLTPLQWDLVRELSRQSENTFIAGDDDQEIYSFIGANAEEMLKLPEEGFEVVQLEQSYRLPQSVYTISKELISNVKNRFPKTFKSRQEKGKVIRAESWGLLDKTLLQNPDDEWLVLSTTNRKVDQNKINVSEYLEGIARHMTYHQSKGKEADNVLMFTEMSTRFRNTFSFDRLIKLYYVAATRAKKRLIVVGHEKNGFIL